MYLDRHFRVVLYQYYKTPRRCEYCERPGYHNPKFKIRDIRGFGKTIKPYIFLCQGVRKGWYQVQPKDCMQNGEKVDDLSNVFLFFIIVLLFLTTSVVR